MPRLAKGEFGVAICCADGRAQGADRKFLRQRCGVKDVDKITCPGAVRELARCNGYKNNLLRWCVAAAAIALLWFGAAMWYPNSFFTGACVGGASVWVAYRLLLHYHRVRIIKNELGILVRAHGVKHVVISAHDECAGNPVSKEEQLEQLQRARRTVEAFGYDIEVILVWINHDWMPEEIGVVAPSISRKSFRRLLVTSNNGR